MNDISRNMGEVEPLPGHISITGGRVIDPANGIDRIADVHIINGKIADPADVGTAKADTTIDGKGLIVAPGLIDMHVHLREPGHEDEETIATGTAAAVAGGFTSVACMPNTHPPLDNEAGIEFIYRQSARYGKCNVFPIGAITRNREGKELAEMATMVRAGAVAFSDDGTGVADASVMLRALQYGNMVNKVLIQHCEEPTLGGSGVMNSGYTQVATGLPGIPALAEQLMIYRDIALAEQVNARYHVAHISTRQGAELVREAKNRGAKVTAEVCTHHLLMTDQCCADYDPNYKMSPPLRTEADIAALKAAVADGTIDCLITDHAPHSQEEKELEFLAAPFGIIGLECALGLFVKALITPGIMDWMEMLAAMTYKPAGILGIDKGTLSAGADADVTIIDPDRQWTVDVSNWQSKSRNCPYDGWQLTGKPVGTIVGGILRYNDNLRCS